MLIHQVRAYCCADWAGIDLPHACFGRFIRTPSARSIASLCCGITRLSPSTRRAWSMKITSGTANMPVFRAGLLCPMGLSLLSSSSHNVRLSRFFFRLELSFYCFVYRRARKSGGPSEPHPTRASRVGTLWTSERAGHHSPWCWAGMAEHAQQTVHGVFAGLFAAFHHFLVCMVLISAFPPFKCNIRIALIIVIIATIHIPSWTLRGTAFAKSRSNRSPCPDTFVGLDFSCSRSWPLRSPLCRSKHWHRTYLLWPKERASSQISPGYTLISMRPFSCCPS